jgi:2'-5' RNA ligase
LSGAPIIVSAIFGDEDFAYLDRLRREHFPPERNQVPAHVTLFHHLAPDLAAELKQRLLGATRKQARPRAALAGLQNLGRGVAFRIESPELEAIRADLADAFAPMLTPQDSAGWRPHVTIQNKVQPAAAKALLAQLSATLSPRPLVIAGLASWWYRGGPWEPLSRHMFA